MGSPIRRPAVPTGGSYRGPRFARRFRFTLSFRLRTAVARFTFERRDTDFFVRFPRFAAMSSPPLGFPRSGYSSQSRSLSFRGRYSSVMKLIPRRLSASSSNFCPDFTISWISSCHCFAWNQG